MRSDDQLLEAIVESWLRRLGEGIPAGAIPQRPAAGGMQLRKPRQGQMSQPGAMKSAPAPGPASTTQKPMQRKPMKPYKPTPNAGTSAVASQPGPAPGGKQYKPRKPMTLMTKPGGSSV